MHQYVISLRSGEQDHTVTADSRTEVNKNGIDWVVFEKAGTTVAEYAKDAIKSWRQVS